MNSRVCGGLSAILVSILVTANVTTADPPSKAEKVAEPAKKMLTKAEARGRAKLLHTTYESTLIAVHRAYFDRGQRTSVPARVLEDVFYWVDEETGGKTRWISVNTEAMNIDHKPKTEIEKQAAKVLGSGKEEFELVKDGVYYRASAIPLVASCLRCHESTLIQTRRRKRVAGLVISMPVKQE